jgi:hypothetical protein
MGFEKLKEKRRGKYKRKENSRESGRIRGGEVKRKSTRWS